jgi:arylesterase/paraoxonase
MKLFKNAVITVLILVLVLAGLAVKTFYDAGEFKIFDYQGDKLVHRRSVSGTLMHSPNDVLPVGPAAFYVTNDHGNSTVLGRMAEEYLQLARSYVLYYDGKNFRKVAEALSYANGINISPDRRTVYVAATVGQKIYMYDRNQNTGNLLPIKELIHE